MFDIAYQVGRFLELCYIWIVLYNTVSLILQEWQLRGDVRSGILVLRNSKVAEGIYHLIDCSIE